MKRFRKAYGNKPLHLLCAVAMLAFAGYLIAQIFDGLYPWNVVLWFVIALVAHDLIAYPLYTLTDRVAQRGLSESAGRVAPSVPAINYLRVPAILCGVLFVVWFPLILRLSDHRYEGATGRTPDAYLGRWLAITAVAFGLSALLYALRVSRARRAAAER